jgi:DNA-binding MarR family transcriptional regulator
MVGDRQSDGQARASSEAIQQEAFLSVLRTNSVLENTAERFFRDYRLSIATYNVLRILRTATKDGMTCSQVGDEMVARVPDVTRLVDRLEEAGLVKRGRERDDRRVVRVALTAAGITLVEKLDQPVADLHRQLLSHMTIEELRTLNTLLEKVRAGIIDSPK